MTRAEIYKVAAEADIDHRTVQKFLTGEPMHEAKVALIEAACRKLKISYTRKRPAAK